MGPFIDWLPIKNGDLPWQTANVITRWLHPSSRPGTAQLCQGTMMRSKVKAAGKSASRPLGWPWMSWGYRDGKPPIPTAKWEIHNHGMEWGTIPKDKAMWTADERRPSFYLVNGVRAKGHVWLVGDTPPTKVLLIAGWQYVAYKHKHACRRKSHTKVAYTRVSKSMYV